MEIPQLIFEAAKQNPVWGLFVFAVVMWWLQWKRNEKRDDAFFSLQKETIIALSKVRETVGTNNTLLTALLNHRGEA